MLNFTDVALRRGPRLLFQQVNMIIHAGRRVGITGANGTGKSSLFALIRDELQTDQGEFSMPAGLELAHVAQETPALERAAIDYVMDGDAELRRIEAALVQAESAADGHRQGQLHARFDAIDGYSARARAARLLRGLGFSTAQENTVVREFSGGWRMRLNLAQALMCRSDLLLLDEPTNHLDLDAVIWLQDWLRAYPGTLLLISHDRDFLDTVVDQIAHVEHQSIQLYSGNYSDFETARAEQLRQQQAAFDKQQREIAHVRSFVDRFRAQATKAKQAQSRLKMLARMETIAQAHVDSPFHFQFCTPLKLPNPLLRLDQVAAGYGDTRLLDGIEMGLAPGDRLGLLGANGAGKSTLIKLLAGALTPQAGELTRAKDLAVGYFAQHQLEQLTLAETPFQHLRRLAPQVTEQSLRDYLGGFGFSGQRVDQQVADFSGGEKARLVLALLVYQRPNLLLLDEPTNHLDIEMRLALGMALQDYPGAMVIVSHDRHMLRSVCDDFLLVADGQVHSFGGDLDDYREWLSKRLNDSTCAGQQTRGEAASLSKKQIRRHQAERRKRLQPLQNRLKSLEAALDKLMAELDDVEQALTDPVVYQEGNKDRLTQLLSRQGELKKRQQETEEAWLQLGEELQLAELDGEDGRGHH
ncbi:ABC transporter ATP-binding protein [Candidatus Tenderia electrophaga]|jgi:ATP-binding cassette subfamily F protein 3|uniref:Probable ATP-binding protein YheS n=1 Tax=Candidatus Tenderia electrophaga TaxID=1748243 RepID=A0A0S2TE77_9GAMM|nr:ABC transporter ATP-binding protein [Candidatus Tenderia electrophaga]